MRPPHSTTSRSRSPNGTPATTTVSRPATNVPQRPLSSRIPPMLSEWLSLRTGRESRNWMPSSKMTRTLLLTAGDNIDCLHRLCGVGVKDCTKPYGELIDAYPELFRSTPFMPVLGNHDREIRPRGPKPPAEPVYDIEATAFRKFFELPDDEWKWHFDLPDFGVRFVALDFNHTSDMGTTWQTCHPLDKNSAQFQWYEKLMSGSLPPFVVTLYNEQHASIRGKEDGAWHKMISRGTIAVTGFGYFAERAEVDGFTCYNTSLSGRGDKYPDPKSQFLASEDSYLLMSFTRKPSKMVVELKGLDGRVLDRKEYRPKQETQ